MPPLDSQDWMPVFRSWMNDLPVIERERIRSLLDGERAEAAEISAFLGPMQDYVAGIAMLSGVRRGPSGAAFNDSTYNILIQESDSPIRHPYLRYGVGATHRVASPVVRPPYRPARETPLNSQDTCRCVHFEYENAPHQLRASELNSYEAERRQRRQRQAFGEAGTFSTLTNRDLVGMRQARAMAGLDTNEYDTEITRRVLADSHAWGQVGSLMRRGGWVDRVIEDGPNYVFR